MLGKDGESLELKECTFVPGLYQIFDELLVNAADNKYRKAAQKMTSIKVDINPDTNTVSVWNDGKHKVLGCLSLRQPHFCFKRCRDSCANSQKGEDVCTRDDLWSSINQ